MAKAPMMPVWTDALVADTTHLTPEQFGCYVLILLATWRNNGIALPDDDQKMARICRISVTRFRRKIRPFLIDFFSLSESRWRQLRLEKEWNHVERLFEQKANAGVLSGKARRSSPVRTKRGEPRTIYKESLSSVGEVAARACVPSGGAAHARGDGEGAPVNGSTWKPIAVVLGQPVPAPPQPSLENLQAEQRQRHMRFLKAQGTNGDLHLYLAAQPGDDPEAAQRMFDLTEARMRREHWDDTRETAA